MTSNILLTPELRKKVSDRIKECIAVAEQHYKQKFEFPEIRYDIKNHVGGTANAGSWLIRLNLILLVENEEHFIKQIVAHEMAHLINRQVNTVPGKKLMPHGKEWKSVMALLGIPANVTHSYDCVSIQKSPRKQKKTVEIKSRVHRLLRQFSKLTDVERAEFLSVSSNIF